MSDHRPDPGPRHHRALPGWEARVSGRSCGGERSAAVPAGGAADGGARPWRRLVRSRTVEGGRHVDLGAISWLAEGTRSVATYRFRVAFRSFAKRSSLADAGRVRLRSRHARTPSTAALGRRLHRQAASSDHHVHRRSRGVVLHLPLRHGSGCALPGARCSTGVQAPEPSGPHTPRCACCLRSSCRSAARSRRVEPETSLLSGARDQILRVVRLAKPDLRRHHAAELVGVRSCTSKAGRGHRAGVHRRLLPVLLQHRGTRVGVQ